MKANINGMTMYCRSGRMGLHADVDRLLNFSVCVSAYVHVYWKGNDVIGCPLFMVEGNSMSSPQNRS
jgi:hypothetical protein